MTSFDISDEDLVKEMLNRDIQHLILEEISDRDVKRIVEERWMEDEFAKDVSDFGDQELINELEYRGYIVRQDKKDPDIFDLYRNWVTLSKESFEKEMKKFFRKTLDIYVR